MQYYNRRRLVRINGEEWTDSNYITANLTVGQVTMVTVKGTRIDPDITNPRDLPWFLITMHLNRRLIKIITRFNKIWYEVSGDRLCLTLLSFTKADKAYLEEAVKAII